MRHTPCAIGQPAQWIGQARGDGESTMMWCRFFHASPKRPRTRLYAQRYEPGMSQPATVYEIRVHGHLAYDWSEWFDGLKITHTPGGETILTGPVRDQAELFGVLMKVRDLGLTLISVNRVE
jgi:hypothetical protein